MSDKSSYWYDRFWPMWIGPDSPIKSVAVFADRIRAAKCVAVDCETAAPLANEGGEIDPEDLDNPKKRKGSALSFKEASLVGVSLTWREDTPPPELAEGHPCPPPNKEGPWYPSIYIPLGHHLYNNCGVDAENLIQEVLGDTRRAKVTHNGFTFDGPMFLAKKKWVTRRPWLDTSLMAGMWNEHRPRKLKVLGEEDLGFPTMNLTGLGNIPFDALPPSTAYKYACQDSHLTYGLMEHYAACFKRSYPAALTLLGKIDFPMSELFYRMSATGMTVNWPLLRRYQAACAEVIEKCTEKARKLLGADINLGSPIQVRKAFAKVGLPIPNAQAETLAALDHPAAKYITLANTFTIYLTRYVDGIAKHAWPDGRVRPTFVLWEVPAKGKKAGTVTGRASARNPLVHQFPKEAIRFPVDLFPDLSEGVKQLVERVWNPVKDCYEMVPALHCRALLGAHEGHLLVASDLSQIEPRVSAAVTGEPLWLDGYRRGIGIYKPSGARIFHKTEDEVHKKSKEYKAAKVYILTKNYLGGAETVLHSCHKNGIEITLDEVKADLQKLAREVPLITAYPQTHIMPQLLKNGYVESIFGRRRRFPLFHPKDHKMLRQATNSTIQGPAYDIMKLAMLRIDDEYRAKQMVAELCLNVHDEAVTTAPYAEVMEVADIQERELTRPVKELPHQLPLECETEVGKWYGRMVSLETYKDMVRVSGGPVPDPYAYEPTYRKMKEAMAKSDSSNKVEPEPKTIPPDEPATSAEDRRDIYRMLVKDVLPCQRCSLSAMESSNWTKVGPLGTISEPVDVMWLIGHPTPEDLTTRRILSGAEGSLIRQEAYRAGLPIPPGGKSVIASSVWCAVEDSKTLSGRYLNNCRPYLERLMELTKPKVVVALGSVAMRSLLRINLVGLEDRLGWHRLPDGTLMMVTYGPKFLFVHPGYTEVVREHLDQVKRYLSGGEIVVPDRNSEGVDAPF